MRNHKIEKADKKKIVWKTVAGVSIVSSIALFGLLLLIMRGKKEKN